VSVACVNGVDTWQGYQFPGMITDHSKTTRNTAVAGKWQVPINFHIGSMGLAPAAPAFVDSVPPMVTGGNLDDRRIGVGATMYYKVQVNGGLLSMGDAHMAQGDSELDGTGIETHITGDFRLTLIKQGPTMPAFLSNLYYPLLENANEYVIHGFTYNDYLTEARARLPPLPLPSQHTLQMLTALSPMPCRPPAWLHQDRVQRHLAREPGVAGRQCHVQPHRLPHRGHLLPVRH
jgi:hypothetical protein